MPIDYKKYPKRGLSLKIKEMILDVLQTPAIAEVIRDRINLKHKKYYYASYITKHLSFLIKENLVESKLVFKDNEQKHYAEYCLKRITAPTREDSVRRTANGFDKLSCQNELVAAATIEDIEKIKADYPEEHPERKKIDIYINSLKQRK